jgi:hypothetical protein
LGGVSEPARRDLAEELSAYSCRNNFPLATEFKSGLGLIVDKIMSGGRMGENVAFFIVHGMNNSPHYSPREGVVELLL